MNEVSISNDIDVNLATSDSAVIVILDNETEIIQTFEQGPPGPPGPPGPLGSPGIPGNTVLYGTVDPIPAVGTDGNFYINTTTHFMFGPKASNAWPPGTSLIGPQGPKGDKGDKGDIGAPGTPGPPGSTTVTVSDTPPVGVADNTLWWESDSGLLFVRYNDGTSTQWVTAAPQPDLTAFVGKVGDTMTGSLTISMGSPELKLSKAASGGASILTGQTNAKTRWRMALGDSIAESGANAGSNFSLARYDDSGAVLDTCFTISRVDASASMLGTLTVAAINGVRSTAPTNNAHFYFYTSVGGTGGIFYFEAPTGHLKVQVASIPNQFGFLTTGLFQTANGFVGKQGSSGAYGSNGWNFYWSTSALQGWVDNVNLGNVSFTSDYRIKKDVVDLPPMWETVKALRPVKYTQADFTPPAQMELQASRGEPSPPFVVGDDIERWGFIAHELQETMIMDAATGVKDQPDLIQSPNPFTLIAALTKALQEAMARIETLEAKVP